MYQPYLVVIHYREPTYVLHQHAESRVYRGSYEVEALSPQSAIDEAKARFAAAAKRSSVRWVRTIVACECKPLASS